MILNDIQTAVESFESKVKEIKNRKLRTLFPKIRRDIINSWPNSGVITQSGIKLATSQSNLSEFTTEECVISALAVPLVKDLLVYQSKAKELYDKLNLKTSFHDNFQEKVKEGSLPDNWGSLKNVIQADDNLNTEEKNRLINFILKPDENSNHKGIGRDDFFTPSVCRKSINLTVTHHSRIAKLTKVLTEKNELTNAIVNFINSDNKIENSDLSIIPKPFLLLAGISGTGKSRFVREQATAARKGNNIDNFCLVPVRPDWHEPADLLGYRSRISGDSYVVTDFLKFLVQAWINATDEQGELLPLTQHTPHWLCLDEMNLAPVEQYFADYLSVIETREWNNGNYSCDPLLSPLTINHLPPNAQLKLFCDLNLFPTATQAGFTEYLQNTLNKNYDIPKYVKAIARLIEHEEQLTNQRFSPWDTPIDNAIQVVGQYNGRSGLAEESRRQWATPRNGNTENTDSGDGDVSAAAGHFVKYCNCLNQASPHRHLIDKFLKDGISLPPNLIVAGTVNMDETTHGFSRKVIDRALTLDFQEFFPNDFDAYLKGTQANPITLGIPTLSSVGPGNIHVLDKTADPNGSRTMEFTKALNNILNGTPFQLAYRALNEALLSVACLGKSPVENSDTVQQQIPSKSNENNDETESAEGAYSEDAPASNLLELRLLAVWDDFLMQKVLPRIEGDMAKLRPVNHTNTEITDNLLPDTKTYGKDTILHQLYGTLQDSAMFGGIWGTELEKDYDPISASGTRPDLLRDTQDLIKCRSRAKLRWMMRRLKSNHFTDFWC